MSVIRFGIDIGSTTVKVFALSENEEILYADYKRHRADIQKTVLEVCNCAFEYMESHSLSSEDSELSLEFTGSGGFSISHWLKLPFVQEVIASSEAVKHLIPETDVAIELGGEDAKITYFGSSVEQRMNGTCAGGTGAFIDQMASLLETDASGLNELARTAKRIYPIAARCGVFAKTDIQPLINEGAAREDIAASIFQAVVNQTISGLACGRAIRGNVAFLGGPLHFLDQLRERFIITLNLSEKERIIPRHAELFVAAGCAYSAPLKAEKGKKFPKIHEFRSLLKGVVGRQLNEVKRLEPLFESDAELADFRARHKEETVARLPLEKARGALFLGLDSGSTTTKAVLIDEESRIVWSFYDTNRGNPVELAVKTIRDLYENLPESTYIARSGVTGYGESLFCAAFGVDVGEVETMAHFKAARHFVPDVDFILDIGGQDMKSIRVHDGVVTSISLNEACSAGCGSFLENFARTMGLDVRKFSERALRAENPVDLGSRCTVFMNSRVKQSQKEGASVSDISAGLSYSVIKNALFKVIKLRSKKDMGERVVVQGGTFKNDAVLRAFEKIAGVEAFRPDIAGLMGAYGAALIALEAWKDAGRKGKSNLISLRELEDFKVDLSSRRCGKCRNNCLLTVNRFSTGDKERFFVTGNRCEVGLHVVKVAKTERKNKPFNMFAFKNKRLFSYKSPDKSKAPMGEVGIPRVLNMWENYPLWFTFFTSLGFFVHLSPHSSKELYESAMDTIPDESVCYPAKLAHAAVKALIEDGVKFIFYPCILYEKKEDKGASDHYNCPVVASYSEVIKNNFDEIRTDESLTYMNPFLPIYDKARLKERLFEELHPIFPSIEKSALYEAVDAAWAEQEKFHADIRERAERELEKLKASGARGLVLAGRPYHDDPEINHGIPELINDLGLAVFSEDSVAHLGEVARPLRVVDQWTYHNRLYRAASFVAGTDFLDIVQLTSFGCGLDAVTGDQVDEIMKARSKMYNLIKIDEGNNLGAVRIRLRSLICAAKEREKAPPPKVKVPVYERKIFTKKMRRTHTILAPQMSPIHFRFVQKAFEYSGYNFVILKDATSKTVETGLKYVNNDSCYPSILVTGQLIEALESGKYDRENTSVMITQTGGGCRATNYIGFIRRALADAGFSDVPVISLSSKSFEKNPGFKITFPLIHRALMALVIGDVLMRTLYRTRPYEKNAGEANRLYEKWAKKAEESLKSLSFFKFSRLLKNIISEFDSLPLLSVKKPRVGVVGEILVKYHPSANNHIVELLEKEGCECVMLDLVDFFTYTASTGIFRHEKLAFPKKAKRNAKLFVSFVEFYRRAMKRYLNKSRRFSAPSDIYSMMRDAAPVVKLGNITGEGWFLTAEMIELLKSGVTTIACVQPFACLPNHITGKGVLKELRRRFKGANIQSIDYDPGASEVNQLNRLKLLLSQAKVSSNPAEKSERNTGVEEGILSTKKRGIFMKCGEER